MVSEDGRSTFVADSSPGDVYAVRLPDLVQVWKQHVGGAPFGLLMHGGRLYVSLFDTATVVELDPASGRLMATHHVCSSPAALGVVGAGDVVTACREGKLSWLGGKSVQAGEGFGVAAIGDTIWTAGYSTSDLVPLTTGGDIAQPVHLPLPVHPFWIAPGAAGSVLISAEGANEDTDPGAVFSYEPMTSSFTTLARPRDPDQVLESGSTVFVAAHGDSEVLALRGGKATAWAQGASAVGLAADSTLGLLAVVVNAHE